MMPYAQLLQTTSTLPGAAAVAQEFLLTPDTAFGEGSLAVFVSATGSTPDVNQAIDWAKAKGATTVGFTGEADSPPFAKALDHVFLSSAHSYDIQLLLLITGLLRARGEFDDYEELADQLALLPGLLVDVAKKSDSKRRCSRTSTRTSSTSSSSDPATCGATPISTRCACWRSASGCTPRACTPPSSSTAPSSSSRRTPRPCCSSARTRPVH